MVHRKLSVLESLGSKSSLSMGITLLLNTYRGHGVDFLE